MSADLDQATVRTRNIIPMQARADCWQRIALSLVQRKYRNRPDPTTVRTGLSDSSSVRAGDRSQNPDGLLASTHEPAEPAPGLESCYPRGRRRRTRIRIVLLNE